MGLPGGSTVDATYEGDVLFPGDLKLENVLFETMDCDLIFVP